MPRRATAAKKVVPSTEELVAACGRIKSAHADYGVKRVFLDLVARRPDWLLTERRVQRVMRQHALTLASSPQQQQRGQAVFPDDCVCPSKKRTQVGWVLRAAGALGGEDSVEDTDSEEDRLPSGTARVQWIDRYEPTVERVRELTCLDRPLVVGDVVSRRDDPGGAKLGTVAQVEVSCEVRIRTSGGGFRRKGYEYLDNVEGLRGGRRLWDPVRKGKWVGRISGGAWELFVKIGQQTASVVADEHALEPVEDADWSWDDLCPYFVGQRVSGPPSVWKKAKWDAPRRRHKRQTGVVLSVSTVEYAVQWLAWGAGADVEAPPDWISPDELEFLDLPVWSAPRAGERVSLADGRRGQILATRTQCRVRWDSDVAETWISSLDLVPRQQLGEHDFLPNDLVVRTGFEDGKSAEENEEVGVVLSVDGVERTVAVRWKQGEEIVSAYEVALHPIFQLSPGDVVLRAAPGVGQAARAHGVDVAPEDGDAEDVARAVRESLAGTAAETPQWLGQVLSTTKDGTVRVRWLDDGRETEEIPEELLGVPEASEAEDQEEEYDEDDEQDDDERIIPGPTEQTSTEDLVPPPPPPDRPTDDEQRATAPQDNPECCDAFAVAEVVPVDHAFAGSEPHRVALAAVRKLWAQLKKSLPEGVAVRAFEDRADLLRVVIFGPDDTPYDSMLFLFDVQLSASYPREPPAVFYHAMNNVERLNPNLYENGKVCLSLLGTWSGPGWDPDHSTLLQLLVSLQGLVLVDKPYYNEPGNEKHSGSIEGEAQARLYNENARLLAIKATIPNLKRPPLPLKDVVVAYYRHRRDRLTASLHAPQTASEGFKRVLARVRPLFLAALDTLLGCHPPTPPAAPTPSSSSSS